MCFEVTKWLEIFNSNGEDIFGEEYEVVLALIGIANLGISKPLNDFVDNAEKFATNYNEKKRENLIKGFGLKLEGEDDTDNKLKN